VQPAPRAAKGARVRAAGNRKSGPRGECSSGQARVGAAGQLGGFPQRNRGDPGVGGNPTPGIAFCRRSGGTAVRAVAPDPLAERGCRRRRHPLEMNRFGTPKPYSEGFSSGLSPWSAAFVGTASESRRGEGKTTKAGFWIVLTLPYSTPQESDGRARFIHCQCVAFFRVDAKQEIRAVFMKKGSPAIAPPLVGISIVSLRVT